MKEIQNLRNARIYALLFGAVCLYLYTYGTEGQLLALIGAGISAMFAVLDTLLLLYAENRDSLMANPLLLIIVLIIVFALIVVPCYTAGLVIRYAKAENNISYAAQKDSATVRQVYGNDTIVEIAENYKEKPVTEIGTQAFLGRTGMTAVILPDTAEVIGSAAFAGCTALKEIDLPNGMKEIKSKAFAGCTALEYIDIPESVTEIAKDAFVGCSKGMTIRGTAGSAAEEFAESQGILFEVLD